MGALDNGPLTESAYYILLSLYTPRHGYAIMQNITELSNGRINMGPGTLYGAITNLIDKGWITLTAEDSRKKEYQITKLGKEIMEKEVNRLNELVLNGKSILKEDKKYE